MKAPESRYVEKQKYLSRYAHARALRSSDAARERVEEEWLRGVQNDCQRFVPFLAEECGLEFRGRILEIGAGGAWLSAEVSKLPRVVEIITTDLSPKLLKESAPKVFEALKANTAKITRMPGDFHQLDFPKDHFDFVVCSSVLHQASNMVQVLREVKRVLKPGGRLVAIREPVWPLMKLKTGAKAHAKLAAEGARFYALRDYKEFFKQAALPLDVKRVNLSRGFKYYINQMVNGLTHARYAFIGTKRGR